MERKHDKTDVGVIVGRFQVAQLHPGHLELLLWVAGQHQRMVIVLGTPAVGVTRENPLDYGTRFTMLTEAVRKLGLDNVVIVSLPDRRDDQLWSTGLDAVVQSTLNPGQTVTLYGSRDSFLNHYCGKLPTQELVGGQEHWSGTQAREALRVPSRRTEDFRAGVIWATQNRYPAVLPTIDVALYRKGQLLLVRKPGEQRLRLLGGFAEPTSASFEEDAHREVGEEVNIHELDYLCYVGSTAIEDWRYRGRDRIKTLLFAAAVPPGVEPIAADDVIECKWVSAAVSKDLVVPEHHVLLDMLRVHYDPRILLEKEPPTCASETKTSS